MSGSGDMGWWCDGFLCVGAIVPGTAEYEVLRRAVTVGLGVVVACGYAALAFNWQLQRKLRREAEARVALHGMAGVAAGSGLVGVGFGLVAGPVTEGWAVYDAALLLLACGTWAVVLRTRGLRLVDARLAEADELEAAAARYREIAEHMPHVVWTAAVNGHVDFTNERWRAYAGATRRSWVDAVHPDERAAVDVWWTRALVERKPVSREVRLRGAAGGYRTFLVSATPVVEGAAVRWFGACADVEDQKQLVIQKDIQARQKAFFFNALSHDLRAPLNNVVLNAQLLTASGQLDAEMKECADVVVENAMDAGEMLTRLLDFARVGAMEHNHLAPVFLTAILHHVERRFQPVAAAKRISLTVTGDRDTEVVTDRHKVERIVSNLVDNAVKFTARGGVTIELRGRRDADGAAVIRVSDTGPGVPPADAPLLFGEFYQADGPVRERRQGFGMGLAICRALARQLGGDVVLASTGPAGTCFELTLPGNGGPGRAGDIGAADAADAAASATESV